MLINEDNVYRRDNIYIQKQRLSKILFLLISIVSVTLILKYKCLS